MKLDLDFEPDNRPDPAGWPGPIALLGLALVVIAIIWSTSCATTTFYGADGKPTARIMGNFNYHRTAAGTVTMSINHSQVIDAQGRAVGVVGSAVTALSLAAP